MGVSNFIHITVIIIIFYAHLQLLLKQIRIISFLEILTDFQNQSPCLTCYRPKQILHSEKKINLHKFFFWFIKWEEGSWFWTCIRILRKEIILIHFQNLLYIVCNHINDSCNCDSFPFRYLKLWVCNKNLPWPV